ncbi:hypothetical protein SK128_003434, partial [Halocaridina rubra]
TKKGAVPKAKPDPRSISSPASSSKLPSEVSNAETDDNQDDALERFPLELRWCLQQLEQAMEKKKSNPKEAEDILKSYKILAGRKAPFVKKRQLMRSMFGDYRKKMAEEEKKFKLVLPTLKAQSAPPNKSKFLKHKSVSGREEPIDEKQINTSHSTTENVCENVETQTEVKSPVVSKQLDFNSGNSFRFNFTVPT